jgi:hypothetical protein
MVLYVCELVGVKSTCVITLTTARAVDVLMHGIADSIGTGKKAPTQRTNDKKETLGHCKSFELSRINYPSINHEDNVSGIYLPKL